MLLDESDAAFKGGDEYAETLRGILNTGHKRGGKTSCCVGVGANMTYADFSTFCPKAIAGIGTLPDTVRDRSIQIQMKRRSPDERVEKFRRRRVRPLGAEMHQRVARLASRINLDALASAEPEVPDELDDRAADGWEPLFAIADVAGKEWPSRARDAARALSAGHSREDESEGVRLLGDIRDVFQPRAEKTIATRELIEKIASNKEAPWADWWRADLQAPEKGAERRLAARLRAFDIRSKTVRLDDEKTAKGYHRDDFDDAWRRYLPKDPSPPSHPASRADSDPPQIRNSASQVTEHDRRNP